MNVAWKFIAVLALLFSLAALVLEIVRIQSSDDRSSVRQEIGSQIAARERAIVDRLAPRINAVRADLDLPATKMQSLDELIGTLIEPIETVSSGKGR